MATASEVRQLLKDYQSLTASSRAAGNSDPAILGQLTDLKGKLQAAADEGYTDAEDAAKDIAGYETLINSNIAAQAPAEQKAAPASDAGPADHGPAYDDEGNLMPGYTVNENGDAVWVGAGYNDSTGETVKPIADDPGVAVDHGPAYDDDGNLMPGWSLDEENNPVWVGSDKDGKMFVEPATAASAKSSREAAAASNVVAKTAEAKASASKSDSGNFKQASDWRIRLSLAPSANYLYKAAGPNDIMFPLKGTDGVIFPYMPTISTSYRANYDPADITHSNYKLFFYKNSSVEDISITAEFTAQDTSEANYMLAAIHFFKSATKMFYGQDGKSGPRAGTPPPLCYLSGLGSFQFDNHPLVITSFTYSLPNDVDYIRAGVAQSWGGQDMSAYGVKENSGSSGSALAGLAASIREFRLKLVNLKPGAAPKEPQFKSLSNKDATYVPTKMSITITCSPIVTRNDISNNFSLQEYATGKLLRGSQRSGGGIW
jgi:hypothetical protein